MADTLSQFEYEKPSAIPKTETYSALSIDEIKIYYPSKKSKPTSEKITFINDNLIVRAKHYVKNSKGVKVFIPNPANEELIGGGAFVGAPNFEEDLFRISNGGIALVYHAREHGDFKYVGRDRDVRPAYCEKIESNQALVSKDIKIIKEIIFKRDEKNGKDKHWYGKEFKTLPVDEQFNVSMVSNAARFLPARRSFTDHERQDTIDRIRAHMTAIIAAGSGIAIFTDFGCGGFNNPPNEIAEIYADLLVNEGYIDYFEHVEFAIITPSHSQMFKEIFVNRLEEAKRKEIKKTPTEHVIETGLFKDDAKKVPKKEFEIVKSKYDTVFLVFSEMEHAIKFVKDNHVKNIYETKILKNLPLPDGERIKDKWVVRLPWLLGNEKYYEPFCAIYNKKHPNNSLPTLDKIPLIKSDYTKGLR